MNTKEKLAKEIWQSEDYYHRAKKGSLDMNHPGMRLLQKLAQTSHRILDLGCGEGTRLNKLSKSKIGVGVDISQTAINLAKRTYPKIKFIRADLENIPLSGENFDLVYSAFVLEHLSNPVKVLLEAISLISKGGYLVLIAPNFGAPNRCSPPFKGSRVKKFISGLMGDIFILFKPVNDLGWVRVKPIANHESYDIDWDTTIEPYINPLLSFLKNKDMEVKQYSTCWEQELPNAKLSQRIFHFLGHMNLYPFNRWGPHLVVAAQRK